MSGEEVVLEREEFDAYMQMVDGALRLLRKKRRQKKEA